MMTISGTRICLRRGGTGGTLLYLHGAGGSAGSLPMLEKLASRFDVIVPDHPGFGESEVPAWLDNIHDVAYFTLDLMAALELRDVHLVGMSLGGWLAMEMAVRSTARLASLTLVSAAGLNVPDVPKGDLFLWNPAERWHNLIHDQDLAAKIAAMPVSEDQAAIAMKNEFATARLAWDPRFFDPHLHKWLHRIDVPTAVIWGAHDKLFPLAYGENIQRHIPGSRLHVIPNCGHVPHTETPDALVRLIDDFTASVRAAR